LRTPTGSETVEWLVDMAQSKKTVAQAKLSLKTYTSAADLLTALRYQGNGASGDDILQTGVPIWRLDELMKRAHSTWLRWHSPVLRPWGTDAYVRIIAMFCIKRITMLLLMDTVRSKVCPNPQAKHAEKVENFCKSLYCDTVRKNFL
jgi:hypothetical protein